MNIYKHIRSFWLVKNIRKLQFQLIIKFNKKLGKEIVHFIHIGKTGGTSIKHAFNNKYLYVNRKVVVCLHNHSFRLDNVPDAEKVFFVVRDPIERFISGFYSRKRKGMPRIYSAYTPEEEIAFNLFDTPNELALALTSEVEKKKQDAEYAMNKIGHVNTSYWDWFIDPKYLNKRIDDIAFVACLDNFDNDFEKFKNKYKIASKCTLPKSSLKKHSNPKNVDKDLDTQSRLNLIKWYTKDYEFLKLLYNKGLIKKYYNSTLNND